MRKRSTKDRETEVVRGLEGVVAAETDISFVDGIQGDLYYKGYNIHDIAEHISVLYQGLTRVNPNPHRQANTFFLFQTGIESCHRLKNAQPCVYRTLRIIFMRLGPAKIDHEAIAKVLGNVAVVAFDNFSTGGLVGADDVAQVFRVELA